MKKVIKRVLVEGTFLDLKGGNIFKTGVGKASTVRSGIARAFDDMLKKVKGKHIHSIKAVISIVDIEEEVKEGQEEGQQASQIVEAEDAA